MYTLTPNTLIESAKLNQNFTDLSTGVGDDVTNSLETFRRYNVWDHVVSGGVWSGDSYGSNRNASMTSIVAIITGKYVTQTAITAHTFTASKDTYVDMDYTGAITYTEVSNNAASPSLSANNIRIAIIITGASNIANVGSINQGQESILLPIVSSMAYQVTDSLGNQICNRNPLGGVIGYRQFVTGDSVNPAGVYKIPQLSGLVVKTDGLRKIKITACVDFGQRTSSTDVYGEVIVKEGSTQIALGRGRNGGNNANTNTNSPHAIAILTPSAGSHTYDVYCHLADGTNMSINGTVQNYIIVEVY